MTHLARSVTWTFILALLCLGTANATAADAPASTPPEKALRYHKLLLHRLDPDTLFDRFYDAWLTESSARELEAWLADRAAGDEAADDFVYAFFLARQGRISEATRQLNLGLKADPNYADGWYLKSQLEAQNLDFEQAISDLDKAAAAEPDEELARKIGKSKGQLLVRSGDADAAMEVWKAMLEASPDDEYLYEDVIELQIAELLYAEAIETSKTLIDRTTDSYKRVLRQMRVGDIHQRAGQYDEALKTYSSTLEQVGTDTWLENEVLSQIEQVFRREENLRGLASHLEEMHEAHPQRIALLKRRADVLHELGEVDQAIEMWQQVLKLTPGNRENRVAYVVMLEQSDRIDEAIEQSRSLLEANPNDSQALLNLAELQARAEDLGGARETMKRYVKAIGPELSAQLRAARQYEQMEMLDEAEAHLQTVLADNADDVVALEAKAEFLYRQDRKDEALATWREMAAKAAGRDLLRVAQLLAMRGEHQEALSLLEKRFDELSETPGFLEAICRAAAFVDETEKAIPWSLQRVRQADSTTERDAAITQATQLIAAAKKTDATIQSLKSNDNIEVNEHCLLIQLLEKNDQPDEADAAVATLIERDAEVGLLARVSLLRDRREWSAAAAAMTQIVEQSQARNVAQISDLAQLHFRAGDVDAALKWIDRWQQISPNSPAPWLKRADMLTASARPTEAVAVLRRAAGRFPDDQSVAVKLATELMNRGQMADAERMFWRLYEESQQAQEKLAWVSRLIQVARQQGRIHQLAQQFELRKDRGGRSIVPYLALAEIHRAQNNYEERRKALTEAARLQPDNVQLMLTIASIEEEQGDFDRAIATLQKVAEVEPQQGRQRLVQLYLTLGEEEKAYELLYENQGGEKIDVDGVLDVAAAMAKIGDFERMNAFLGEQLIRFPEDYRIAFLQAVSLEEGFEIEKAAEKFVGVMAMQKEIAGAAPQQQVGHNPWTYQVTMYGSLLPPESLELMMLAQMSHYAYQYRNMRMGRSSRFHISPMMGMHGSNTMLPTSVEQARQFAFAHLNQIYSQLDEPEREKITAVLAARDMPLHVMLLSSSENQNQTQAAMLMQQHADNPAVVGWWLVQNSNGMVLDEQGRTWAKDAARMFKDSNLSLALMASSALASSGDFSELETLLPKVPQDKAMHVVSTVSLATLLQRTASGLEIPEKLETQLVAHVLRECNRIKADKANRYASWAEFNIINTLAVSGRLEEALKLVSENVDDWQDDPASAQQLSMAQRYYGNNFEMNLPFPPIYALRVPPMMHQLIAQRSNSPFMAALKKDAEAGTKSVLALDNAALRLLLLITFDDKERLEAQIEEATKADDASLDVLLIAAAWEAQQANHDETVKLLSRAAESPTVSGHQDLINIWLVNHATQSSSKDVMKLAHEAALKLKPQASNQGQQHQLIAKMVKLGLDEEAQQWQQQLQAMQQRQSTVQVRRAHNPVRQPPDLRARAAKLIAEGETERAAKIVSRDLIAAAQAEMMAGNNYQPYQAQQIVQVVTSLNIEDEVLAAIEPEEGDSARVLTRFGIACELLGKAERASEAYQKAYALRPDDGPLLLRMGLVAAEADPAKGAEYFAQISSLQWDRIIPAYSRMVQQQVHQMDGTVFLNRAEAFVICMESEKDLEADAQRDWSMSHWLLQVMEQSLRADGRHLPPMYQEVNSAQYSNQSDALKKTLARRDEVHARLATAMLEFPSVATMAFSRTVATAELAGEDLAQFEPLAKRLILDRADVNRHRRQQNTIYYSNQNLRVSMRTPEAMLAWYYWQNDDRASMSEFVEATKEKQLDAEAARLAAYEKLYFVPEEKFVDAAKEALSSNQLVHGAHGFSLDAGSQILDVLSARDDFETDKVDLLLTLYDAHPAMANAFQQSIVNFVKHLEDDDGPDAIVAFLEKLGKRWFGTPEQQTSAFEKYARGGHVTNYAEYQRVQVYRTLISRWANNEDTLIRILPIVSRVPQQMQNARYQIRNAVNNAVRSAKPNDTDRVMRLLASAHLLDDLSTFDVGEYGSAPDETILSLFKTSVVNNGVDSVQGKAIVAAVKKHDKTFGRDLILALLTRWPDEKVYQLVGDNIEQLKKLPNDKQQQLAVALADWPSGKGLDAEAAEAFALIDARRSKAFAEVIKTIEAAVTINSLPCQPHEIEEWGSRVIQQVSLSDEAKAIEIWAKLKQLHANSQQANSLPYSLVNTGFDGQVANNLLRSSTSQQPLGFIARMLEADDSRLIWTGSLRYELRRGAREKWFQSLGDMLRDKEKQKDGKPLEMLTQFHREVGDVDRTVFVRMIQEAFSGRLGSGKEALEWLKSIERPSDIDATLDCFELVIRFELGRRNVDRESNYAFIRKHYLQCMNDSSKSLAYRVAVGRDLLEMNIADDAAAMQVAALMVEAHAEDPRLLPVEYYRPMLRVLAVKTFDDQHRELAGKLAQLTQVQMQTLAQINYRTVGQTSLHDMLGQGQSGATDADYALMLACKSGDQKLAESIVFDSTMALDSFSSSLTPLVRAGYFETAMRLLRNDARAMVIRRPREMSFDATLAEQLDKLLETIDKPGEAAVVTAMLASLADDLKSKPPVARDERMKAIAEGFAEADLEGSDRLAVLAALASDADASEMVSEQIVEVGKSVNMPDLLYRVNGDRDAICRLAIWIRSVDMALAAGDAKPAFEQIQAVASAYPAERSGQFNNTPMTHVNARPSSVLQSLKQVTEARAKKALGELDVEQLKTWLPLVRRFAGASNDEYWAHDNTFVNLHVLLMAVTGQMGEWEDWHKTLDESARNRQNSIYGYELVRQLKTVFQNSNLTGDEKAAVVAALMSHERCAQQILSRGNGRLIDALTRNGVINKDQYATIGLKVAKAAPRGGMSFVELATVVGLDKAPEDWLTQAAAAAESGDERIAVARALNETGRSDEAAKLLSQGEFDEETKAKLDALRKEMSRSQTMRYLEFVKEKSQGVAPDGKLPEADEVMLERIASAETIDDLGLRVDEADDLTVAIVERIYRDRRKQAAEAWQRLDALYADALEKQGNTTAHQRHTLSRTPYIALQMVRNSDDHTMLGFVSWFAEAGYAKSMWSTTFGRELRSTEIAKWWGTFTGLLNKRSDANDAKLRSMLIDLDQQLGSGDRGLLVHTFHSLSYRKVDDLSTAFAWLDEQAGDEATEATVECLRQVFLLDEIRRSRGAGTQGSVVNAYHMKRLADDELSFAYRVALASHLMNLEGADEQTIVESVRLMRAAHEHDPYLVGLPFVGATINAVFERSHEKLSQGKPLSGEAWSACMASIARIALNQCNLEFKNPHRGFAAPDLPSLIDASGARVSIADSALYLASAGNDLELIEQDIIDSELETSSFASSVAILLSHSHVDQALKLYEKRGLALLPRRVTATTYSAEYEASLSKMVGRIDDAQMALHAEAMFAGIPDNQQNPPRIAYEQRMAGLVDQYRKTTFDDDELRLAVLAGLAADETSSRALRDEMAKAASQVDFVESFKRAATEPAARSPIVIWFRLVDLSLADGDPAFVMSSLEAIDKALEENPQYRRSFQGTPVFSTSPVTIEVALRTQIRSRVEAGIGTYDLEQISSLLPLLEFAADNVTTKRWAQSVTFASLFPVYAAAAGKPEHWEQWFANADADVRAWHERYLGYQVTRHLQRLALSKDGLTKQQKVSAIARLMAQPRFYDKVVNKNESLLDALTRSRVLVGVHINELGPLIESEYNALTGKTGEDEAAVPEENKQVEEKAPAEVGAQE